MQVAFMWIIEIFGGQIIKSSNKYVTDGKLSVEN